MNQKKSVRSRHENWKNWGEMKKKNNFLKNLTIYANYLFSENLQKNFGKK